MDFRPFWDVLADLGIRLPDAARLKKRQADSSPDAPPVEKKQPSNPPVPPRPEIKLRGRANPGSPQMEGPLELFDMLRQLMGETSRQGQGQGQPPLSDRNWLPPDQTQTVAGHEIPGMVYVGDHLFSLRSYNQVEPSLIRPNLKVANFKPPRPSQDQTSYACPFLSYSEFTALERGAYLHWLASGRRTPEVDWNFVWLFFYGLERRVFYDYLCDFRAFQQDVAKQAELSQIMAEVEDLQQFYGDRPSFPTILQTKFTQFLLLGRLLQHPHPSLLADDPDPLQMPLPHLLVALGEKMASGEAIAPDWAFAWYTRLSSNRLKGSVSRCPDEFQTLFQLRYNKKHPKGWTVKPSIAPLVIPYYAASPSFGGAVQLPFQHLADATRLLHLIREIGKIIGSCTEAIEPLTRFLARNPDSRYAPTAIALLPPELLPTHGGELMQRFQECLDFYFEDEDTEANVLYGNELLDYWPGTNPDRLTKSEAEGLSKFLERLGFGIEPDVRFGGAAPKATSRLMLFRLPEAHPAQLAPEYATATLMAHLAIATASGTQPPNAIEQAAIFDQLNHFADWHPAERTRLQAYYHLLLEEKPTLKGLKSRVEALAPEQRDAIAPWLITIAAADGQLTPKEIQQIEKVYTLLGRDPKTLYSDIHAISTNTLKTNRVIANPATTNPATTNPATTNPVITSTVTSNTRRATRGKKNTGKTNKGKNPATEPVTVRPAVPVPGHAIPSAEPTEQAAEPSFVLDQATIQSKISESEEVSALLSNIFTEDAVTDSPLPPASSSDAVAPSPVSIDSGSTIDSLTAIAGLDTAHSLLLQAMAERESWMRVELEAIATSLNLMLDGALELINEAAFDRCDEPLLEGDDPIELNPDVLQELLA